MTADPVAEVVAARDEARRRSDPHVDVCVLATATAAGRPEARAVSLRDIDARGFGLLLNVTSPKWRQIEATGQCALLILWSAVRRQYRVHGDIRPMEPGRVLEYWMRKDRGSRLLEHYYGAFHPQSEPIPSRDYLLRGIAELGRRHPRTDALLPPDTLHGIYLFPTEIDVWHGSPEDRLHDRRLFTRTEAGWSSRTLVP